MKRTTSTGSRRIAIMALGAVCIGLHCALASGNDLPPVAEAARAPVPVGATTGNGEAEGRFQQGLRLAAANKTDAAIKMFLGLTVDYPLLPQPHVQLAALYVQQGKLSRAIDSLHAALERKLDDGLLQENLGDLYVELARQSYKDAVNAVNPAPGAADKYAALQKVGSRAVMKGSVQP